MHSLPSVLIYGRDSCLLDTRRWVLEKAGFLVSTTMVETEATRKIDTGLLDLFILCHTLDVTECASILGRIHALHPSMKTLILNTSRSGCESAEDYALHTFASPQALISAVCEVMKKNLASA